MRVTSLKSRISRPFSGILLFTSRFRKSESSYIRPPRHCTTIAPSSESTVRVRVGVEMISGSGIEVLAAAADASRVLIFNLQSEKDTTRDTGGKARKASTRNRRGRVTARDKKSPWKRS